MTKYWTTYLPIGAAIVLMLAGGYVQGIWSERWGSFPELKVFADQLADVPRDVGEWRGADAEGSDEKTRKWAGAEGELVRNYTNANGDVVRISLICGRLRDITYHTPDRCYPAAGFEMTDAPRREVVELPGGDAAFYMASFTKSEATGSHSTTGYWSWTGDGNWSAPDNTKADMAKYQRALYKLYAFTDIPAGAKQRAGDRDVCKEFLRVFIPALNKALNPAFEKVDRIDGQTAEAPEQAPAETKPAA